MTTGKQRVLIAAAFLKPGGEVDRRLHEAGLETEFNPWTRGRSEDELIRVLRGVDGVLVAGDRFTARVIEASDRLKVISRTGVGYDGVDVGAATARGIAVCTTPGVNRYAVADFTMALILACARRLAENFAEIGKGGWSRYEGRDLRGYALGLIGLGAIGKETAKRAQAFGMRVVAYDPFPDKAYGAAHDIELVTLEQLLLESDYVSLHCNLSEQSRHLIDAARLGTMKPTAFLINTARGGVVDTAALYEALKEKRIAGAALDTFETEPLDAGSQLRTLDNVYLSPHVAGVTSDARKLSGMGAAENAILVLRGEKPHSIVNPEVLAG